MKSMVFFRGFLEIEIFKRDSILQARIEHFSNVLSLQGRSSLLQGEAQKLEPTWRITKVKLVKVKLCKEATATLSKTRFSFFFQSLGPWGTLPIFLHWNCSPKMGRRDPSPNLISSAQKSLVQKQQKENITWCGGPFFSQVPHVT